MKYCLLLLLTICFTTASHAQTTVSKFQMAFGGAGSDVIRDIKTTADSGYLLVGSTESFGGAFPGDRQAYIAKTNADGSIAWTKTYGTNASEELFSIETANNGGFYVVGNSTDSITTQPSILLLHIDASGNLLWSKLYSIFPTSFGSVIKKLNANKYAIGGKTFNTTNSDNEAYMMTIDSSGAVIACRGYNGDVGFDDNIRAITPTADAGFIMTGDSYLVGIHSFNVLTVKTDSTGVAQWIKTYASSNNSRGYGAYPLGNNYLIGGQMVGAGTASDLMLLRVDSIGNIVWTKTYGGGFIDFIHSFVKLDSSYALIGETQSFSADNSFDAFVVRTDDTGNVLSAMVYGDSVISEAGMCATAAPYNVLTMAGTTNIFGQEDGYFVKMRNDSTACHQSVVTPTVVSPFISANDFLNTDTLTATQVDILLAVQNGYMDTLVCFTVDTIHTDTTIDTPDYIKPVVLAAALDIYPNPSTGIFTAQLPPQFGHIDAIHIINSLGQDLTASFSITQTANTISFKAKSYAPGIYLLSLQNDKGQRLTARILIE